jgi:hypothetical protein
MKEEMVLLVVAGAAVVVAPVAVAVVAGLSERALLMRESKGSKIAAELGGLSQARSSSHSMGQLRRDGPAFAAHW